MPGDRWTGGGPLEFAFWIGFALPFGPVLGLARTVLVLLGWRSLRRGGTSQRAGPPGHRPP